MFGSDMIYWRAVLAEERRAIERSPADRSHSDADQQAFDRRLARLAEGGFCFPRATAAQRSAAG